MAFDVTNLTDFTQKATEFLLEGIVYSEDYSRFDIMTGVQHKQYLNYLDAKPKLQAGTCGVPASGDTEFNEKEIEVKPIAITDKWCLADLQKKDIVGEVGTGKGKITNDLRIPLVKDEIDKIKKELDRTFWVGDLSLGDMFNGIVTEARTDTDVITVPSVAVTVTNIDSIIADMIAAIPADMWSRGGLTIHMGMDYFNLYRQNRVNANFYHMDPANQSAMEIPVFGFETVIARAEPGLNGSKSMLLTWDKNIIYATDELVEVASAQLYFEPISKYVYFLSNFKLGVTYKFGTEIVYFLGA